MNFRVGQKVTPKKGARAKGDPSFAGKAYSQPRHGDTQIHFERELQCEGGGVMPDMIELGGSTLAICIMGMCGYLAWVILP